MRLLSDLARGAAETIRETLPSDEREAGVWVSGLAWAFVLHWAVLLWVTWGYCSSRGGCV